MVGAFYDIGEVVSWVSRNDDNAPGGNTSSVRYVINRFSDQASLDAWENSEVALSLIDEINKYSTLQRVTGLETWFTIPDMKAVVHSS